MTVLRAPFTMTAVRRAVFCVASVVSAAVILVVPALLPGLGVLILWATGGMAKQPAPTVAPEFLVLFPLTVALLVVLATPAGRALGTVHRALADRLLGVRVDAPPVRVARRIGALISDGTGWRGLGYGLLKVPLAVVEGYGAFCYVFGVADLSYPLWWPLFRNHPAGTTLGPVRALTPLGTIGTHRYAGTFLIAAAGLAMLLVAPWLMRVGTTLDIAAARWLLGPRQLAERVRELQVSRARAIDDAAAMMRRLERDLHDGAQIRLATLAMNLGMATEKLGADGPPPDLAQARELVALAHRGAKDALAELRDLVRGIHPPVLDNGLGDALATLATGSAIPVTVSVDLPARPSPAIETIAYFCAAELLANATKHSQATRISLTVTRHGTAVPALRRRTQNHPGTPGKQSVPHLCPVRPTTAPPPLSHPVPARATPPSTAPGHLPRPAGTPTERLVLTIEDDGVGGADPNGAGLCGLAARIDVVDGRMRVQSPAGGPTRVDIELPVHA